MIIRLIRPRHLRICHRKYFYYRSNIGRPLDFEATQHIDGLIFSMFRYRFLFLVSFSIQEYMFKLFLSNKLKSPETTFVKKHDEIVKIVEVVVFTASLLPNYLRFLHETFLIDS